jgi:hypothetical protein
VYEVGDSVRDYRIRSEARKVSDPLINSKDRKTYCPTSDPDGERRSYHRAKAWMDSMLWIIALTLGLSISISS